MTNSILLVAYLSHRQIAGQQSRQQINRPIDRPMVTWMLGGQGRQIPGGVRYVDTVFFGLQIAQQWRRLVSGIQINSLCSDVPRSLVGNEREYHRKTRCLPGFSPSRARSGHPTPGVIGRTPAGHGNRDAVHRSPANPKKRYFAMTDGKNGGIAEAEAAAADHSLGDRVARAIRIFNSATYRDGAGPPALPMPDAPELRREFGAYHQNAMAFMAALEKLEQSNALLAEAGRRSSGHVCSHLCGTSAPAFPHDALLAEASAKGWP